MWHGRTSYVGTDLVRFVPKPVVVDQSPPTSLDQRGYVACKRSNHCLVAMKIGITGGSGKLGSSLFPVCSNTAIRWS